MPSSEGFCRRERNPACVGFWSRSRIDSWCAALQRIGKQIQHGQLVWRRRPLPLRPVGVADLRPEPTFGERFLDDGSSDGLPVAERIIILLALGWSPVWRQDVRLSEWGGCCFAGVVPDVQLLSVLDRRPVRR